MLRIRSVQPLEGLRVRVELTDGQVRDLDLDTLLHGPVFDSIRSDRDTFRSVRVDPEWGTLVWPNGADLDPDVLILNRPPAGVDDASQPGRAA